MQYADLARTPEGLAIWLAARSKFPAVNLPSKVWHSEDPLHRKNKHRLAGVLRETSAVIPKNTAPNGVMKHKGVWNTKLHFAWDVVMNEVLAEEEGRVVATEKASKRLNFQGLWLEAVDGRSCSVMP